MSAHTISKQGSDQPYSFRHMCTCALSLSLSLSLAHSLPLSLSNSPPFSLPLSFADALSFSRWLSPSLFLSLTRLFSLSLARSLSLSLLDIRIAPKERDGEKLRLNELANTSATRQQARQLPRPDPRETRDERVTLLNSKNLDRGC